MEQTIKLLGRLSTNLSKALEDMPKVEENITKIAKIQFGELERQDEYTHDAKNGMI